MIVNFRRNLTTDCWANHWYNPPRSPRAVLIQSEQKGWQNHSGPLTSSTLPLWTITVWSTLQSSEHQNDQTQKQFLPSGNPSHEHLTLNMEHTTILYIIYSSHILIFLFQICTYQTCTHNCLYYILCFFFFLHCLFVYLYIILYYLCHVLLLSFCCTVELLTLKQIPCMWKHSWPIKLILILVGCEIRLHVWYLRNLCSLLRESFYKRQMQ